MFCTSCGKTLEDGALFCTGCGKKVEVPDFSAEKTSEQPEVEEKVVEPVVNQDTDHQTANTQNAGYNPYTGTGNTNTTSQNTYSYGGGNQQMNGTMNQQPYGSNQQFQNQGYAYGGNQQMNGAMNQGYQQMGNQQNAYVNNLMYKRSVLPFKIVPAITNIITMILVLIIALASIGIDKGSVDGELKYIRYITEGYGPLGVVGLIFTVSIFVLMILGFALPAKGGVTASLIGTLISLTTAIWSIIVTTGAHNKCTKYSSYLPTDVKNFFVGMNFFAGIIIFFVVIALIMEVIGFTKKKIY